MTVYDESKTVRSIGYNENSFTFRLVVDETSVDKTNNKSHVKITEYAYGLGNHAYSGFSGITNKISTYDSKSKTITQRVSNSVASIPKGTTTNIISSWEGDFEHNSDGTLNLRVTTKYSHSLSSAWLPISPVEFDTGEKALTSIPRESKFNWVKEYIDETSTKVNITKYSSDFYSCILIYYGNTLIKTTGNLSNGENTIQFTTSEYNTLYNATKNVSSLSLTLKYVLKTYSDSSKTTQIGSDVSLNGIFTFVESKMLPTFNNFTYADTNSTTVALTGNNQIVISGYSNVKITISTANKAVGKKAATISGYTFQDGLTEAYSSSAEVTHPLNKYNYSGILSVTAKDSRGFQTPAQKALTLLISNYTTPVLSNVTTIRKNGMETETYLGLDLKLWNGNYNGSNRANDVIKFQYRSKKHGETTWGSWHDATSAFKTAIGNVYNGHLSTDSAFKIHENGSSGGFTANIAYDIQVQVYDGYGTTTFNSDIEETYLDGGNYLDTYMKSGNGYKYAINGMLNQNLGNGLQIYGNIYKDETILPEYAIFQCKYFYNNSGAAGYYKIFHLRATPGWGNCYLSAIIHCASRGNGPYGVINLSYYDNTYIKGVVTCGDINYNGGSILFAIKNSDNTLDVYIRQTSTYSPVIVQLLSYSDTSIGGLFNGTGYIGTTAPSGTQTVFKNIVPVPPTKTSQLTNDSGYITRKSCIMLCAEYNTYSVAAGNNMPFNKVYTNIGDAFEFKNNRVYAKRACTVLVSAQVWVYYNGRTWLKILRNGSPLAEAIGKSGSDNFTTFSFAPRLMTLSSGDWVTVYNNSGATITINDSSGDNQTTYITVQEV
jgi:hypothetical protein